jgi:hypothetical protein
MVIRSSERADARCSACSSTCSCSGLGDQLPFLGSRPQEEIETVRLLEGGGRARPSCARRPTLAPEGLH